MEKLSDMLSAAQFSLVKKSFSDVDDSTMLIPVGRIADTTVYREVGTPHRWQLDHANGFIIGVHRQKNFFRTI